MLTNILLGLLTAAIGGAIAVVGRQLRRKLDPEGNTDPDRWKLILIMLALWVAMMAGFAWLVSKALGWLARYTVRVLESALAGTAIEEDSRPLAERGVDFLTNETWLWAWPSLVVFLSLTAPAVLFALVLDSMELSEFQQKVEVAIVSACAIVGAILAGGLGAGAHWGFNESSAWLFEESQKAVSAGRPNYYPSDQVVQIGWSIVRSAVTVGMVGLVIAGAYVGLWRLKVRASALVSGNRSETETGQN